MSVRISNSNETILEDTRVSLTNVEEQTEIAAVMSEYGYGSEELLPGKALLDLANQAYSNSRREAYEESEAYAAFATCRGELEATYAVFRKKAKVVFRNDQLTLDLLGVSGDTPRAYVSWLNSVRNCCKLALGSETILAGMGRLNCSSEDFQACLDKCDNLDVLRAAYLREKGESQNATKTKDAAFVELDKWMRDFYAVAKIALEDQPQLLESLGVVVKS
ncbi:hypothetical protein [Carboxylicivirga sp. M1479]|uniref:hypothetical protein n=1 Tax=Carboxylicivirga sp. M1479 TaxID=2594476 RepID=UPI001178557A|nr:hypothetical protein [Carboxylicivirga sp. M1479]TRX70328.1 hypothetical protein FNN09_12670 [Carboxylicivirga sp. M1479]